MSVRNALLGAHLGGVPRERKQKQVLVGNAHTRKDSAWLGVGTRNFASLAAEFGWCGIDDGELVFGGDGEGWMAPALASVTDQGVHSVGSL